MSYRNPAETTTAQMATTVVNEGWSVVGVLDRPFSRRLLGAVAEVAARSADAGAGGQLHLLSGLAQHPDLAEIVDWPPLLALAVELLSPNIYINHSHLDVHPPHPPTGGRSGIGARELARALLFDATDNAVLSERYCRDFTHEVLAHLPEPEFVLGRDHILA